jgi:hypothetical protein
MRLWLLSVAACLASCSLPSPASITEPPKQLQGGWTLTESTPITEAFRLPLKPTQSWKTHYRGPQDFDAALYRFNSSGEAFEALQKWQKAPGEITFHDGNFFVVVPAKDIPKQASGDFVEALMAILN